MKDFNIRHFLQKIPLYIYIIFIVPVTFNHAAPRIVQVNHYHYEMMEEMGEEQMFLYLAETMDINILELESYNLSEQLWQIQMVQISLVILQTLITVLFILFALAMTPYYLSRRRIKFKLLLKYANFGLLVSSFIMLVSGDGGILIFTGSLVLASSIYGFLCFKEMSGAMTKDYLGEEHTNNGVY